MNKLKSAMSRFVKDESGQGATEYILLLVVVIGVIFMFGPKLKQIVQDKMGSIEGDVNTDFMN